MTKAQILLADSAHMGTFYFTENQVGLARQVLAAGGYRAFAPIETNFTHSHAAEEMFDLTNNPSRQDERELKYGRHRSVSVGDIVNVDGVMYVCCTMGWEKL